MTIYLIDHIPVGDTQISQRVIACEMKLALKHFPVWSESLLHEQIVHAVDEQGVEQQDHR